MTVARSEFVTTARPSSTTGALSTGTIGEEFLAPPDDIDFDAIEVDFDIGVHSTMHDLANHVKVGVPEGVDPSDSLGSLETKTATHDGITYMLKSRFFGLTNDRPCQAILEVLSELLHSPQLYRRRAHVRKRLEWLDCPVIASDASNLSLAAPVSVPGGVRTPTVDSELHSEDGGLKLNLATRVDGQSTHPLAATVTGPNTHETTQYDHLADGVRAVTDQDNPIEAWDRGYTDYDRFCAKKRAGEDFVTTLKSNARTTLLTRYDEAQSATPFKFSQTPGRHPLCSS